MKFSSFFLLSNVVNAVVYEADMKAYPGYTGSLSPSGILTISEDQASKSVSITGDVAGLDKDMAAGGIHIHSGTNCNGYEMTSINNVIGAHLFFSKDGWLSTVYNTDAQGTANIAVTTKYYSKTEVNNRCLVMHGASSSDKSTRVAVGQITCPINSAVCTAQMNAYPGCAVGGLLPTGVLTVSFSGDDISINGQVDGLAKNVNGVGIHIHTGTDCTGGSTKDPPAINSVVGGHLFYSRDGWLNTVYNTDNSGKASVNVEGTSYVKADVENRCIVMHGASSTDTGKRVAVGKIKCASNSASCTATMGPYPGDTYTDINPEGSLTVSFDDILEKVTIKGDVTGLAKTATGFGIHVHTGTDCTGAIDYNSVVGGHLTYQVDGWLDTTYTTNVDGKSTVALVSIPSYKIQSGNNDAATPPVEGHCIVMHGGDLNTNKGERVAIGKIEKTHFAKMGAYPKADLSQQTGSTLSPKGELYVTEDVGSQTVSITGTVTGLGENLNGLGIHVHTGTDCSASTATTYADANTIIGGHLLYDSDGWLSTTYNIGSVSATCNEGGQSTVDIKPPANSYSLKKADAGNNGNPATAVEDHCIVMHGAGSASAGTRVAIGKIVCSGSSTDCTATMGPYPLFKNDNPTSLINPSGDLTVSYNSVSKELQIQGTVKGLVKESGATFGIHVHTGTDCSGGTSSTTTAEVNQVVGGHLLYPVDGWLSTTYQTNSGGVTTVNFSTGKYSFEDVRGKCLVMHGKNGDTNIRVAVGKIESNAKYFAKMGQYPSYSGSLAPSGYLEVAELETGKVTIAGDVTGLVKNAVSNDALGIHVHSGTDCTGGGQTLPSLVNAIVGGHLMYAKDGWDGKTYASNSKCVASVSVSAGSYKLDKGVGTNDLSQPEVNQHCVVMHGEGSNSGIRVAIGKIQSRVLPTTLTTASPDTCTLSTSAPGTTSIPYVTSNSAMSSISMLILTVIGFMYLS